MTELDWDYRHRQFHRLVVNRRVQLRIRHDEAEADNTIEAETNTFSHDSNDFIPFEEYQDQNIFQQNHSANDVFYRNREVTSSNEIDHFLISVVVISAFFIITVIVAILAIIAVMLWEKK